MRLRYVGSFPVTFSSTGLEVHPDDEFSVPDEDASAYLSRSDIVLVETSPPIVEKPSRARKTVAEEPPTVDQSTSSEESAADAEVS